MQAVIRTYSGKGAAELLDLLERNQAEIEATMRAVPGLVSYTLVRTEAGGVAITVCQDQAGIEASTKIAREWVAANARGIAVAAPEVSTGRVVVRVP
ncbi:MAG: hypothetical protein V4773_22750 [Verrucomicrobiota bacterium]